MTVDRGRFNERNELVIADEKACGIDRPVKFWMLHQESRRRCEKAAARIACEGNDTSGSHSVLELAESDFAQNLAGRRSE